MHLNNLKKKNPRLSFEFEMTVCFRSYLSEIKVLDYSNDDNDKKSKATYLKQICCKTNTVIPKNMFEEGPLH